jgi:NAD(P)-dependent dehydrogenase (short-subunit alcohol dehydrogenase family)
MTSHLSPYCHAGIILAFLRKGATVVAPMRSENGVEALKSELKEDFGSKLKVSITDVSIDAACADLAALVTKEYGAADHVVSCIGGFPPSPPGEGCLPTNADVPILHDNCSFSRKVVNHV